MGLNRNPLTLGEDGTQQEMPPTGSRRDVTGMLATAMGLEAKDVVLVDGPGRFVVWVLDDVTDEQRKRAMRMWHDQGLIAVICEGVLSVPPGELREAARSCAELGDVERVSELLRAHGLTT